MHQLATSLRALSRYLSEPRALRTSVLVRTHNFYMEQRLCVAVRTYSRQQRGFTALVASLLAARDGCGGNVSLSVDVFPTDSTAELGEATLLHAGLLLEQPEFRSLSLHTHRQLSTTELTSIWNAKCGRRPLLYDYGYLQSDVTLQTVLARSGRRECTYVMVTNGDNLYANSLLDFTCPHMRRNVDVIGWWFSSHNAGIGAWGRAAKAQGKVEHVGTNVLFRTKLRKSWMDLGAVMIRADLLRLQPAGRIFTDCGAWREADGRAIERLVRTPNVTQVVLQELLFFHQ